MELTSTFIHYPATQAILADVERIGMTDLSELINRLEKLEGPDRGADLMIHDYRADEAARAAGLPTARSPVKARPADHLIRTYTASIDAALTLVPEGWLSITYAGPGVMAECFPAGDRNSYQKEFGATPAIALCVAALKARLMGEMT